MLAAVSCSSDTYRLGGVGLGCWLMGKLGRAWHRCMGGAWCCLDPVYLILIYYLIRSFLLPNLNTCNKTFSSNVCKTLKYTNKVSICHFPEFELSNFKQFYKEKHA